MIRKIGLILALFLAGCQLALATAYYFDATDGNDGNTGLSPAQAWQTLTKCNAVINAVGFAAGDSVLFQRGETFAGQISNNNKVSGSVGNPIVFSAYGTGAKPIINAATIAKGIDCRSKDNLTFSYLDVRSATSEQFYLFGSVDRITLDSMILNGGSTGFSALSGGCSTIVVQNCEVKNQSAKSFWVSGLVNSTFTNITQIDAVNGFVYAGSGSNVLVSNSTFTSNTSYNVWLNAASGVKMEGVTASESSTYGFYFDGATANDTLIDCFSIDNTSTGVVFYTRSCSGFYLENFVSRGNGGNGFTITGIGTGYKFLDCDASMNDADGFNSTDTTSGIDYDGCRADSTGGAPAGGDAFTTHRASEVTIRNCQARDNVKSGFAGIDSSEAIIYYSRFSHSTNGTIGMIFMSGTGEITIHNNTIYSGGTTGNGIDVAAGVTADIRNNIVYGGAVGVAVGVGATLTEGNNNIFASTTLVSGFAMSSSDISISPAFFGGQNDLRILRWSRCINRGVGLGYTVDYSNNPIRGNPDIGAWESVNSGSGGGIGGFARERIIWGQGG